MKILAFIFCAVLLTDCSKNPDANPDNEFPVIVLNSPVDGQAITGGQKLDISGTVSDNNQVTTVHIHVYNNNTGQKLMDIHLSPGSGTANFQNNDLDVMSGVTYKIEVIAIDKAINEARKTVLVVGT